MTTRYDALPKPGPDYDRLAAAYDSPDNDRPIDGHAAHHLDEVDRIGGLRVLAHSGAQRNAQVPEVQTFKELGYRGLEGGGWYGLFATGGSPEDLVAILEAKRKLGAELARIAKLKYD